MGWDGFCGLGWALWALGVGSWLPALLAVVGSVLWAVLSGLGCAVWALGAPGPVGWAALRWLRDLRPIPLGTAATPQDPASDDD